MAFVKIPRSYFAKAKLEYSDWRFAWFREVVQNSVDAGCSTIRFTTRVFPEGNLCVSATDDGTGMSEDIIVNVLLALGESAKSGEDPVGGFGMAKNLILLAHESWSVISGSTKVSGVGGNYEVDSLPNYQLGTRITVTLDAADSSPVEFENALLRLVRNSNCPTVAIYLNDVLLERNQVEFDYEKSFPQGLLSFSDSTSDVHSLWVRVNGIPMFEYRLWSKSSKAFRAVLELKDSRSVLNVNRDGLKSDAQRDLNELIHSLSEDLSTLKRATLQFKFVVNPNPNPQFKTIYSDRKSLAVDDAFSDEAERTASTLDKLNEKLGKTMADAAYPLDFQVQVHSISLRKSRKDTESISLRTIKSIMVNSMTKKLAHTWMVACKSLLSLPRFTDSELVVFESNAQPVCVSSLGFDPTTEFHHKDKLIKFGFIFDANTQACCVEYPNSIHFLLNPTIFNDDLPWKGRMVVANLMDVAFHEVSHVYEPSHGPDFCLEEMKLRRQYRAKFYDGQIYNVAHRLFVSVKD